MPEDDLDQTDDQGEYVSISVDDLRGLRNKARASEKADTASAELAAAQRELAFIKAGVDTDSAVGKLLVRAYDGPNEVEAIKAAWLDLNPSAPEPDLITAQDRAVAASRGDLASGAFVDIGDTPTRPGQDVALDAGREALASGRSRNDALGAYVEGIIGAAVAGDKSVVVEYTEPGR